MAKVVVTAQVEDAVKWEQGFRTYADLFRNNYGVTTVVDFAISGNEVAVCFDATDLDRALNGLQSPETAEAMGVDGVKRDTVKVFVLDRELKL